MTPFGPVRLRQRPHNQLRQNFSDLLVVITFFSVTPENSWGTKRLILEGLMVTSTREHSASILLRSQAPKKLAGRSVGHLHFEASFGGAFEGLPLCSPRE